MRVPAADLRAQHQALRASLTEALQRVLDTSLFVGGPEVEGFEREFASYCEVSHAIGVANGTDALVLALRALDIGPGHAVALPSFTFAATAEAVCHVGAHPLLVDIDPATFTLDPGHLRHAVRSSRLPVRAIIPVHLYGQTADMDAIRAVADEVDAAIVEDAAQAHGARYRGRRAGALGRLAAFSFYPTKNLGALGDAGAVTTSDATLAERIALLRDHGQSGKYEHSRVGYNSRLDAVQAAALRVKLRHLEAWNARRRALAALYQEALGDLQGVTLPQAPPERGHVYHLYVVRCAAREGLRAHLSQAGVATAVHYPIPLHRQVAFRGNVCVEGELLASEAAARELLALPLYPELSDDAVAYVCATIREWATQGAVSEQRLGG